MPENFLLRFPCLRFGATTAEKEHCRAFFYNELIQHLSELGAVSFTVPEEKEAFCRKSFGNYWSDKVFSWESKDGTRPYFEIASRDGPRHEVHVSLLLDTDAPNDSWYTTHEGTTSLESPLYLHYVGAGLGLGAVVVAFPLALTAYVICAGIWIFKGKWRSAEPAAASDGGRGPASTGARRA